MILVGSLLRPPADVGPGAIVRLGGDVGATGVSIDGAGSLADLAAVAPLAMAAGMTVPVVVGPLPENRLAPDKRVPYLASPDDAEERLAAVALVTRGFEAGRDFGVRTVALRAGRLALAAPEEGLRRAFARRELEEGDPGHRLWQAALAERRSRSPRVLDACRYSLERLIREAERHGVHLALVPAATPWELPTPREALTLLGEFSGAPLGLMFSPARLAILDRLGLGLSPERRAQLRKAAVAAHATDAVGLTERLLPGTGEAPLDDLGALPANLPVVVSGRPDVQTDEVATAVDQVARLRRAASSAST